MNVWLVNPFDGLPGESLRPGRYAFLSHMLARLGHRVTWWSSGFHHGSKTFRACGEDRMLAGEGVKITLVKTPRYDRNVSLGRVWNHYVYAKGFKAQGSRCSVSPDVIVASAPPLLAASAALSVAATHGARVVVDVQDLWPEAFEVVLPRRLRHVCGPLFQPVRFLANRTYRHADGITAISAPLLQRALSVAALRRQPSLVLPLGVDVSAFDDCFRRASCSSPYTRRGTAEFRIVYGGTIGHVYDVETILEAADTLSNRHPEMQFYIAGIGPDYQRLRGLRESRRLRNVTFTGQLGYSDFVCLLKGADICLSAYVPEAGDMFPNKLFDYLAAGVPIVNSAMGEIRRLIAAEGLGIQYQARNHQSLAHAILELYENPDGRLSMGRRGRQVAEERFDMNSTYPAFEAFLRLVCG